jgi:enamine deaminase RidA (YjgF/YER057c/UK114 family)
MPKRLETGPRLSKAVVHGNTVYLAGILAREPGLPVAKQTEQVLEQIEELLHQTGSDRSHILSCTIFLKSLAAYDELNSVWDVWIPKGHAPARACIQAPFSQDRYDVEIQAIAAKSIAGAE